MMMMMKKNAFSSFPFFTLFFFSPRSQDEVFFLDRTQKREEKATNLYALFVTSADFNSNKSDI